MVCHWLSHRVFPFGILLLLGTVPSVLAVDIVLRPFAHDIVTCRNIPPGVCCLAPNWNLNTQGTQICKSMYHLPAENAKQRCT